MFSGANLRLNKPTVQFDSKDLLDNPEVVNLLKSITEYYSQVNVIYDAELVLTNCEYETVYTDSGSYRKRKDYCFNLRHLDCVVFCSDKICFKLFNNVRVVVPVGKDFMYFFEWEGDYYG